MTEEQECSDFVSWANGRDPREVRHALTKLVNRNSVAARLYAQMPSATLDTYPNLSDGNGPILSNHSGYAPRSGSHNWEHDNTGNIMNYSGVYDIVMSAKAENEGWTPGYDYDDASDLDDESA